MRLVCGFVRHFVIMAMGTLRAAFAGLGLEAAAQSGNVFQSRGSTFNQRPIFSNGQSRNGGVVSLPRQNQARVGAFTQSAAAFLDAEYRPANKGQRGGYAPPVPEYLSVSLTLDIDHLCDGHRCGCLN